MTALDDTVLQRLFEYRAWANRALLDTIASVTAKQHASSRSTALQLLDHCHRVDRVFAAHLVGGSHGLSTTDSKPVPHADELARDIAAIDRWYLEYIQTATPKCLSQRVSFVFTDGDRGCMSRMEMLLHVLTHTGYHRGEAARVLKQTGVSLPWDTFAVFLHGAEPSRRDHVAGAASEVQLGCGRSK